MAGIVLEKGKSKNYIKKNGLKGEQKELVVKYFGAADLGCFKKPMSAEEYHAKVRAKAKSFNPIQRGLKKFGVDAEEVSEIKPVDIYGYDYEGNYLIGLGGLSSKYEVTVLYFSDKQIYVYNLVFDMLSNSLKERAEEYFYKDVTNITTIEDNRETTDIQKGCVGTKVVKGTDSSTDLKIVVPGESFVCGVYPKDNADFESRIRAVKAKLREKKA